MTTKRDRFSSRLAGLSSLRNRLIVAFTAVTVVPLLAASYIAFQTMEEALILDVSAGNRMIARNIAGEVDQILAEKVRMIQTAAQDNDMRSMNPARQLPVLQRFARKYADVLIMLAAKANGDLVARSDGKAVSRINYSDRPYVQAALKTGRTAISDVIVSKSTGELVVALAEPILGPGGGMAGVLIVSVDLKKLTSLVERTKIGRTGYAFVVTRQGRVVIHPDRQMVEKGVNIAGLAPVRDAIAGKTGWSEYVYKGQRKLAGYAFVPVPQWGVVIQQPREEALAHVETLKWTNLTIVAVSLAFMVLLVLALARALFKPLARLNTVAQRVSEGNLSERARLTSRDEIGTLAGTFDDMLDQLQQREDALEKTRNSLEVRVKERTADLQEANRKLKEEIAEREKMSAMLKDLSEKDPLTKLYNRRKLHDFLDHDLRKSSRYARTFSIVMMDLDHFKEVNDRLGHDAGDRVLTTFSEWVAGMIRDVDILARYGGEEFIIVCPETPLNGARVMAERIRGMIAEREIPGVGHITVSGGVAENRAGDTIASIIKRADEALYAAKQSGRNRVEVLP